MTISNEIFKAILSMDAYNRGYDAGIQLYPENEANNQFWGKAQITKNASFVFMAQI